MTNFLAQMLEKHPASNMDERKWAVRQIIQEAVLCGLAQTNFFRYAAFQGGTALRVFYGLDRYSEDLDFTLIKKQPSFTIGQYFTAVRNAFGLLGFNNMTIEEKMKTNQSPILTAYIKGNAREIMSIAYGEEIGKQMVSNENITVKFEVDKDSASGLTYESKVLDLPLPSSITVLDVSSLFAGKISAVIGRNWHSRTKGRDLYDYLFYINRGEIVNLKYLKSKLVNSGHIKNYTTLTYDKLGELLDMKFDSMSVADFQTAKQDISNFIIYSSPDEIEKWSEIEKWNTDFFKAATVTLVKNGKDKAYTMDWQPF